MIDVNTITNMDCLEGLTELEKDSVDCMITDPPYGLKFMGKSWDKALPSIDVFKESLRVLKDGAFAFVMCAPRSDLQARMSILLEDAGFNIGFTPIYWTFASGFPKAGNISKMVDKRLGVKPIEIKPASGVGFMKPDSKDWNVTKNQIIMPEATSDEAKALNGSYAGFQPKPAVEVVIVAMKPRTEKTYVDQALCNGKGVTWLDSVRIPTLENLNGGTYSKNAIETNKTQVPKNGINKEFKQPEGRFPANLLCSDDVLNDGRDRISKYSASKNSFNNSLFLGKNFDKSNESHNSTVGDSGSFSRYFDLDAWYTKKLESLPESVQRTYPFLLVPKASKSEKNKGITDTNNHPTVKPIKLFSYLVNLGSQPNDLILDPFMGSGTTAIASKINNRNYIGFELESEYHTISTHRIKAWSPEPQTTLIESK
jgi:site-specific DNA-methyltransferase (adenine-specific)